MDTEKGKIFDKKRKISIMGIINLTADSYFPGSRFMEADGKVETSRAMEKIGEMFSEGAAIVDIGACSTRPGAALVSEEEEWRRLSPLLGVLRKDFPDKTFSIDTFRAGIVERCHGCIGDFIVNDISAGEDDPAMLETAGRLGLAYIAMHKRGLPSDMQERCDYGDVTSEMLGYFRDFGIRAANAGIRDWILDPGFGFAKTVEQNWQLLRELGRFHEAGRPVLVGISRKSMIYRYHGITLEEALPQTQVLHLTALQNGADILRVHDVAEAARTVSSYRML